MTEHKPMEPFENNPQRPDPIMTIDGAFFWKAADEGRFVVQQCASCDKLWHPPRAICPSCLSLEKREKALSGKGTVLSWAVPVHPPAFGFEAPPLVALVETEEGLRFVTNLENVDPREARIGMPVKVAFAETRGGHQVPVFVAAGEAE
jgi:uncharacterized protein